MSRTEKSFDPFFQPYETSYSIAKNNPQELIEQKNKFRQTLDQLSEGDEDPNQ